jgi:hypothetical protein
MKKLLILLTLLLVAGCAQNLSFNSMENHKRTPNLSYEAYYYMDGQMDASRAVFLRYPGAPIEIESESSQITSTTSTFVQAEAFMNEVRGLRKVEIRYVTYKNKPLGYLFSYNDDIPAPTERKVFVELYEGGGKIHFKAWEKLDQDS